MVIRFVTSSRRGRVPRAPALWMLCTGMVLALGSVLATASPAAAAASPPVPGPHVLAPRSAGVTPATAPGTPPLVNIVGGPVQNAPRLYVVFWDWTADPGGEAPYLTNFLSTVATNPWLATVNQYGGNSAAVLLAGTGTSPSIAADVFGGYEVAAQASTGNLWTVNSATGGADLGLGMASGTSPSIAATNGSYEIAFQANTGFLWTVGLQNTAWGLGLLAGTSPAITAM